MLIREIRQLGSALAGSSLSQSKLWDKDVMQVTPLDLHCFMLGQKACGNREQALKEIEVLIECTIDAGRDGSVKWAPAYLQYSEQVKPITARELVGIMSSMSTVQARALWFGLELQSSLNDVVTMTWDRIPKVGMTDLARKIVWLQPRHMKLRYVFWEVDDYGKAMPLITLRDTISEAMDGLSYGVLARAYRSMVWTDSEIDMLDFSSEFKRVHADLAPCFEPENFMLAAAYEAPGTTLF